MNNKKLNKYIELLLEWQKKLNLISNNSIPLLKTRHIEDSLQLKKFIKGDNLSILDLGSGAGFPGLILSLFDNKNHYILIDSNNKKTSFLNTVKVKLKLKNITIINERIENLFNNITADYLLARGLSNIEVLLEYTDKFLKQQGKAIFLKGKTLQQELDSIKNKNLLNLFLLKIYNNKFNNDGKILTVERKFSGI